MLLYTANIGGYDQVQVRPQPGFDFHIWTHQFKAFSSVKCARYCKICLYLDDISIWLDSNIKVNCDLKSFVDKWLTDDVDMVAMEHGRDCIYEEMDACIERKKDTIENVERQREFYLCSDVLRRHGQRNRNVGRWSRRRFSLAAWRASRTGFGQGGRNGL